MTRYNLTIAVFATLLVLACDSPQTLAPSRPLMPLLAEAPSDGNESKQVIPIDDAFEVDCGAETISARALGWIQIRTFGADARNVEVLVVNITFTMTNAAGETFVWKEVGIDHVTVNKDGIVLRAALGRIGGAGVIGRLVTDAATGEVHFIAGKDVGNAFENACDALT